MIKKVDFLRIILNIKKIKQIDDDLEVAHALGMKQKAFSARKTRKSIPWKKIHEFCQREGIQIDRLTEADEKNILMKEDTASYNIKNIPALIEKAKRILRSDSLYRQALTDNINAFDRAISSEENAQKLEGRIVILERTIKSRNEIPSPETTVG